MGPIWRYRAVVFVGPLIGLLLFAGLGFGPWAALLFLSGGLAFGLYSMTIKCPKCGKPVGRMMTKLELWNAFAPATCGQCGYDLRKSNL